ncbi:uncharacterized protein BJX67DRAFT_342030 [Aspergillus lucknowensis]|uniref:Asx homology domain-containing protein n=1 Tax=Aspergillus lucknowensis TaxID=176173 RepID=A0ABR4M418_9EURO
MESTPKPKRNPRRAAKDRWEEEKLLTSEKSQLVDLPLVKLLALPEAWDCLSEDEKKEILYLLPADTHPNPHPPPDDPDAKIPPLPESFLRYSIHWRDAIRHFQLDLQNGRYDPRWLREAEEAVQQRAAGKFDKFKEEEFEEFWGQKQKMDRTLVAGQSSAVKLCTLIEHGVIRKGDVWKWSRGFAKPKTLIEKEARIIEVNGRLLTFAIPPGQRVFLKTAPIPDTRNLVREIPANGPTTPPLSPLSEHLTNDAETDSGVKDGLEARLSTKRSVEPETQGPPAKRTRARPSKRSSTPTEDKACDFAVEIINLEPKAEGVSKLPNSGDEIGTSGELQNGNSKPRDEASEDPQIVNEKPPSPSVTSEESDEIIVRDIQGPTALTLKMLEVDGRVKPTNGNAWKEIRCFRDNQDMGTLWEVRQAWYVKNN